MSEETVDSTTKTKLVNDMKGVLSSAEALIKETAGDLSGKAKETREKLSSKIKDAKGQIIELETSVRKKAVEGAKETDRVIREHPYESLGVAFGLGLLIGVIINRK